MQRNKNYPLKHVSIRVPWHDNKWLGTVCKEPKKNNSCLILKNCALKRNDELEERIAGKHIKDLEQESFPCCLGERGSFMCKSSLYKLTDHPYKENGHEQYDHFKKTTLTFPSYSAAGVPFQWMNKETALRFAENYDLDLDISREPDLGFNTVWLQEASNQKAMLNCFFQHLEVEKSLCFFYAKDVPFVETTGRVLVGVGRVNHVGDGTEYEYSKKGNLRAMLWEHMIQHSIREDFNDGFLLPYHEVLEYAKEHESFDPADIAVIVPPDKMLEFSYATEHVSNDTAIRVLLECVKSLEIANEHNLGNRNWEKQIKWLHDTINEIQKIRGSYPGLGSALCSFGIERGQFVAMDIIEKYKDKDPWDLLDLAFDNPNKVLSPHLVECINSTVKKRWKYNKTNNSSRNIELLQLISRLDINQNQAKSIFSKLDDKSNQINLSNNDILENPYLLYEVTQHIFEPISFWTVDFAMFRKVPKEVQLYPKQLKIEGSLDERRVRALTILELSKAGNEGHTLLGATELINRIRRLSITPACEVADDIYEIMEETMQDMVIKQEFKDGSIGYQLKVLNEIGRLIEDTVIKRKSGKRNNTGVDWRLLVEKALKDEAKDDPFEEHARQEKAAALKELAESRISVLVGPAGTGKTTVLSILCGQDEIKKDGILFLAPTGKARVRMVIAAEKLGIQMEAYTLAQFLSRYDRYDSIGMIYKLSEYNKCSSYGTVILDETSMLTEDMLGALIDSLSGVKRFILVGDYRQLPPIGAGRPFVDIVHFLKSENIEYLFPRVTPSYAELTITRRQNKTQGKNNENNDKNLSNTNSNYVDKREDVLLAEWFSGNKLENGAELIFQELSLTEKFPNLRVEFWKNEGDFEEIFKKVLLEELEVSDISNISAFNKTLGSAEGKYFNATSKAEYFKQMPSVDAIDNWQILSPVRGRVYGTTSINRLIHKTFRKDKVEYAKGVNSKYPPLIPKPLGGEEIVYGDKVINNQNHSVYHKRVHPDGGLNYLANGEVGIVVGQFKGSKAGYKGQPQYTEVEFSSQKKYTYTFYKSDFAEEGSPPLELAYALTVHKSQGSDFGKTFVIIPNPCLLLSRELLYTALTRQKDKVIVLLQGESPLLLKKYISDVNSDTASRITNLFKKPSLKVVNGKYLEEFLIHCTSDCTLVRSKSELIIYELLLKHNLKPIYEKELRLGENLLIPDFTIIDDDTGDTYYWEHCGMLNKESYRKRWERKKSIYLNHGIIPLEEGGGQNGYLIVTEDSSQSGISIPDINKIIEEIKNS
jgi:ATP-dependent exoDNAse (exonuclease V) alpha subunit